jgi:hypothetical protein
MPIGTARDKDGSYETAGWGAGPHSEPTLAGPCAISSLRRAVVCAAALPCASARQ